MTRAAVDGALRVRLLGGLSVDGVSEHDLGSRKGRTLLKVLALSRGRAVSTDRLAEILWADQPPSRPADQVAVLVSRLRRVLGQDRLSRTDAGYALHCDWLDVDELAARVAEAAEALDGGRLAAARAAAAAALTLARGDLLPEEAGEWVEADRVAVAAMVGSARRIGAEAAALAGDQAAAGALAEQALALDPSDEASLRILMRAHATAGRPAAALAAFARVRTYLAEELGVSPTAATEALHGAILSGIDDAGADAGTPGPGDGTMTATTAGRPDSLASARHRFASPPALVGRVAELATLDGAFADAAAGHSVAVLVEGEPGVGKSALLAAWRSRVPPDVLVRSGRADELGRDLPLQPVADALAAHLVLLSPADRASVLGSDAPALHPLLGVLAGSPTQAAPNSGAEAAPASVATIVVDHAGGQANLFAALTATIDRLRRTASPPDRAGEDGVAVIVIDDLHAAGDATRRWLAFAVRRLPRLLVVAATRPGGAVMAEATSISLGSLDERAVAQLVGADRAGYVHARTGGLPLLVTALKEASDDGSDETGAVSIAEAVERRVGALDEAAGTIRTAAVLGPVIDLDLLADVTGAPAGDLLVHLEAAAAAGLLVDTDGFRFRHELERAALEASTSTTRRALLHRDAARCLAARPQPDPVVVAVHAQQGGEADLAVRWYVAAARAAEARFDLPIAEGYLDAALELGPAPDALVERAALRMATQRLDEAAADAAAAVEVGGGARALEVAGWVAYYRRRYTDALAFADEALLRAADPDLRVSCLALGARVLHGAGALPEGASRLEEAIAIDASPGVRGLAAVWLSHARLHQGRPVEAESLSSRALVDPDALAHPFASLHGRFARVIALGHQGRLVQALASADAFDAAVVRGGATADRFVGPAANARAWLLRWSGRGAEADELNQRAVDLTDPVGPRAEAWYSGMLDVADGRLLAGDADGAAAVADRLWGIDSWDGTMAWHQRHRWNLLRARLALLDGDAARAAALAAEVAADAAARGAHRYQVLASAVALVAEPQRARSPAPSDAAGVLSAADTVDGLAVCAGLEGWSVVASMADAAAVDPWRVEARRRAGALVSASPHPEQTGALVARLLG